MKTLKALSAMLTYPQPQLVRGLPQIIGAIEGERLLSGNSVEALRALACEMMALDAFEVQERYVALFDRGRQTSLHLFEHVHSESRDRGQAMVDLLALYGKAGLVAPKNELPDFLPMVLEYLSMRPFTEAQEMLEDCAHILQAVGERLRKRESAYAAVFGALLDLAGTAGLETRSGQVPEPVEKSLDEEWKDEPVVFGPNAAPCSQRTPSVSVVRFMPRSN
jgi:nitrate reductase delta subunit